VSWRGSHIGNLRSCSWYLDHNIQTYTSDPKGVDKLEGKPADLDGAFSFIGTGFSSANLRASINGYMYANGPLMTMKKGERVRWYLVSLGGAVDGHTPHWHGNVVTYRGHRTDVVPPGAGRDADGRRGPRQRRDMDVSLPRKRTHGDGDDGLI
jgi:hypothetical protein